MSASKRKGTAWESELVAFLREYGFPNVERRALNGAKDRGDVAGIPGVVVEAKNAKAITLGDWMNELATEVANDGASLGVLAIKRRMKGAADAYAVLRLKDLAYLLYMRESAL